MTKGTAPRVTVAIPCYNGASYVGATIESVLGQTRPADEILVVDDGSSDGSAEIIRRYPVHLVQHNGNRGLAEARNTAIAAARGDKLVFVDVDAFADSQLLEFLLAEYDDARVAGVGGRGIEANVRSVYDLWRKLHASQGHGSKRLDSCDFLPGLCASYWKEVLLQVGGFNVRFKTNAEDVDIGYRLSDAGYRLRYVPEAKVYHQRTDDWASLQQMVYRWYYWGYVVKKMNGRSTARLAAGMSRSLLRDVPLDMLWHRNARLAAISVNVFRVKVSAFVNAAREWESVVSN